MSVGEFNMGASFKVDFGGLDKFVKGCMERTTNPRPLMELIGETLVSSTKERMNRGESPDGSAMKPVARKGIPLLDTGLLRRSITYKAGLGDVVIGSKLVYARTHQEGDTRKLPVKEYEKTSKKGKKFTVKAHTVKRNTPARPFLGISEEDRQEIIEMVRLYMSGQMK
jgi:phage gpG-like protein